MPIATLEIVQFRNLSRVRMECSPRLNLITGENASGKTSLLEAIYFLGRTRSFRTRHTTRLIQHQQRFFRVVASLGDEGRLSGRVGVERHQRELVARVDGAPASNLAVLAQRVPVLLLTPDSHRLLEDGPRQRRRFMDWGCFHREVDFLDAWRRFRLALRHRNAALRDQRRGLREIVAWDRELANAGVTLDRFRQRFCGALEAILEPILTELLDIPGVGIVYQRGWNPEQALEEILAEGLDQDRRQGFTRYGPHRASFQLRVGERSLEARLSRGQQKLLVIALILAQARLFTAQRGASCILLVDDLPAELDSVHRERVMRHLAGLDIQLFITAIEASALSLADWPDARRFRLNAGAVEMV